MRTKIRLLICITVLSLSGISLFAKGNIFWEVNSKSGNTVYLLGSIHMADSSFYPLADVIEQSFAKSDYLVTEINLNNVNPFSIMDKITYPDNDSLSAHIADSTMNKIVEVTGMSRQILNRFKPAFIIVTLSTLVYAESGMSAEYGIDIYFTKKADKKTILELESIESQIDVLNMMNKEGMEDKMINDALADTDTGESEAETQELVNAWKNGDIPALEKSIQKMEAKEYEDNKEFYEALLGNRNTQMTEKIKGYLSDTGKKKYFVIVGAAHLIGESGIVRELEKAGYKPVRK